MSTGDRGLDGHFLIQRQTTWLEQRMPPKKRTRRAQPAQMGQNLDSEQTMSDSDSASSVDPDMEILVDFEACAITEDDFHGIRSLLRQAFLGSSVDVSSLTDIVIKQADLVGSSIKVSDDDDSDSDIADSADNDTVENGEGESPVYGVASLVSLDYHKDSACVQQLKEMLLSQCKSYAAFVLPTLNSILSEPVGLLINERLVNIPSEIAPPLLNSLVSEVKEGLWKHRKQFSCKFYILITRSHLEPIARKRKHQGKEALSGASSCAPVFDYAECEVLQKESLLSFDYPVQEEKANGHGGSAVELYRTVMVFEVNKFEKAVSNF